MRPIPVFVLGVMLPVLTSCGMKPDATAPTGEDSKKSEPAAADTRGSITNPLAQADLLRAKWRFVKGDPSAKALSWGQLFPYVKNWQETHPILDFKRKGQLLLEPVKQGGGPGAHYAWSGNDTITLDPKEKVARKLTVKISGDELTLTDEDGGVARFQRQPVVVGKIQITGLALCCDNCAEALKAAFGKDSNISDVVVDVKDRSATLKVPDEDEWDAVSDAVDRAGMHGFFEINGRKIQQFSGVGQAIGDTPAPPKEIVLKKVHACCPGCKKAIEACAKGAKVTLEGEGPIKTVRITGEKLNENEILLALWSAGFCIHRDR